MGICRSWSSRIVWYRSGSFQEKEIIEFKKYCSGFLKSKFNEIDIEFQKSLQNTQREHINIDKESTIIEFEGPAQAGLFYYLKYHIYTDGDIVMKMQYRGGIIIIY
mgnify:CR=1 FL=1